MDRIDSGHGGKHDLAVDLEVGGFPCQCQSSGLTSALAQVGRFQRQPSKLAIRDGPSRLGALSQAGRMGVWETKGGLCPHQIVSSFPLFFTRTFEAIEDYRETEQSPP